jgi:membrane-associated phospholipid phosphatase
MIDWWGLVSNLLWVAGLAVGLAAFSMAHYRARTERVPLRQRLQELGFQFPLCIGMMLFGLGLLFSGLNWWEKIVGGLVAIVFVAQAVRLWKHRPTDLL